MKIRNPFIGCRAVKDEPACRDFPSGGRGGNGWQGHRSSSSRGLSASDTPGPRAGKILRSRRERSGAGAAARPCCDPFRIGDGWAGLFSGGIAALNPRLLWLAWLRHVGLTRFRPAGWLHQAALFAAVFLMAGSIAEAGSVPKLINYQGKLVLADNTELNGAYVLRFELFDAATGGTRVWGESQQVAVVGGIFNVILGAPGATPVAGAAVNDLGFAFGAAERFLQTTIVSGPGGAMNQTLSPRQQLASVPFAVEAFNGVPPGTVVPFFGTVAPPGWELCHGQAVARTGTYARLFAAIGTSCGAPNASTFNLPDLRGRFLRGVDGPDGSDADRDPNSGARLAMATGGSAGNAVGTVQGFTTSMPTNRFITESAGEHDHATHAKGAINYGLSFIGRGNQSFSGGGGAHFGGSGGVDWGMRTSDDGKHSHVVSGGDSETRPLNAACNFIIKY